MGSGDGFDFDCVRHQAIPRISDHRDMARKARVSAAYSTCDFRYLARAGLTLTVMLIFYSQIVFAISLSRSEVLTHNYQEYRKSLGSLLLRDCTSEQRRRPPQF